MECAVQSLQISGEIFGDKSFRFRLQIFAGQGLGVEVGAWQICCFWSDLEVCRSLSEPARAHLFAKLGLGFKDQVQERDDANALVLPCGARSKLLHTPSYDHEYLYIDIYVYIQTMCLSMDFLCKASWHRLRTSEVEKSYT